MTVFKYIQKAEKLLNNAKYKTRIINSVLSNGFGDDGIWKNKYLDKYLEEWFVVDLKNYEVKVISSLCFEWQNNTRYSKIIEAVKAAKNPELLISLLSKTKTTDPCGTVDAIAIVNKWWTIDSYERKQTILMYELQHRVMKNDEYVEFDDVVNVVNVEETSAIIVLERLLETGALVQICPENRYIALKHVYDTSNNIKMFLEKYRDEKVTNIGIDPGSAPELSDEQMSVYDHIVNELDAVDNTRNGPKLVVLCAPAGTGKTQIAMEVSRAYRRVLFLAPTHKALQCLRERIGKGEYKTIESFHRAIDKGHADLVIIDEASMITSKRLEEILRYYSQEKTQILIMGDPSQLPPIHMGHALMDLVHVFKDVRVLSEIKRSKSEHIGNISNLIRRSDVFDIDDVVRYLEDVKTEEVSIKSSTKPKKACNINGEWITDPWSADYTQILAYRNETVDLLNEKVQEALGRRGATLNGCYVGDPVRFDANTELYKNGDIGTMISIDDSKSKKKTGTIMLRGGKKVVVTKDIAPAYACTIHKAQGSGFGNVILYVSTGDKYTLEMVYTAITRAEKSVLISGNLHELRRCHRAVRKTVTQLIT